MNRFNLLPLLVEVTVEFSKYSRFLKMWNDYTVLKGKQELLEEVTGKKNMSVSEKEIE